jgi:hypothetical protein
MAILADVMLSETGTMDDTFMEWLEATVTSYKGIDPEAQNYLTGIKMRRAVLGKANVTGQEGGSLLLKQHGLLLLSRTPIGSACAHQRSSSKSLISSLRFGDSITRVLNGVAETSS